MNKVQALTTKIGHFFPKIISEHFSSHHMTCMVADNCHTSTRHKLINFRLNFNYFELKIKRKKNVKLFCFSLNWNRSPSGSWLEIDSFCKISKQTLLLWNENKNKSEIEAEVKLICSRPGTAIQNRKSKIIMFAAGNCHSKQEK